MALEAFSDLPPSFMDELGVNMRVHTVLLNRYGNAIDDIARVVLTHGLPPENSQNEAVLYTLDGDLGDSNYDDFAHRLHVMFQPLPKGSASNEPPVEALTSNIYFPVKETTPGLRRQIEHGAYLTSITLQRGLVMEDMGPDATSFDAQSSTQFMHQLSDQGVRYKVDQKGGTKETVEYLPEFWGMTEKAYRLVLDNAAQIAATQDLRDSFAAAAAKDVDRPFGITDNLPEFAKKSKDVHEPFERIKALVHAIEYSGPSFGAEFAAQLLAPDIREIASLGIINSATYYSRDRQGSVDHRLEWVKENCNFFSVVLRSLINEGSRQFGTALREALGPTAQIVERTESIARDVQPPNATFLEGSWRIVRAL
jgi:hypothetical protein